MPKYIVVTITTTNVITKVYLYELLRYNKKYQKKGLIRKYQK